MVDRYDWIYQCLLYYSGSYFCLGNNSILFIYCLHIYHPTSKCFSLLWLYQCTVRSLSPTYSLVLSCVCFSQLVLLFRWNVPSIMFILLITCSCTGMSYKVTQVWTSNTKETKNKYITGIGCALYLRRRGINYVGRSECLKNDYLVMVWISLSAITMIRQ